jgi:hypothetical protein
MNALLRSPAHGGPSVEWLRGPHSYLQRGRDRVPLYHLHIRQTAMRLLDEEGAVFPSLQAAREEAILAARELLATHIRDGFLPIDWSVEIADEHDVVVLIVPFREAVAYPPTLSDWRAVSSD